MTTSSAERLQPFVEHCQEQMAHAWVVRAFLRHSDEIEDFPELTLICRAIFDISRALESRVGDPVGYFKMLNKKIGKYRVAVAEFAQHIPNISTHTNFAQSLISLNSGVRQLEQTLHSAREVARQQSDT